MFSFVKRLLLVPKRPRSHIPSDSLSSEYLYGAQLLTTSLLMILISRLRAREGYSPPICLSVTL